MARTEAAGTVDFYINSNGHETHNGLSEQDAFPTHEYAWAKASRDWDFRGNNVNFHLAGETFGWGILGSGALVGQSDPFKIKILGAGRRKTILKPVSPHAMYNIQSHACPGFTIHGIGLDGSTSGHDSLICPGFGTNIHCTGDVLLGENGPNQIDIQPNFKSIFQVNTTGKETDLIEVEKPQFLRTANFKTGTTTMSVSDLTGIKAGDCVTEVSSHQAPGGLALYDKIEPGTTVVELRPATSELKISKPPIAGYSGPARNVLFTRPAMSFVQADQGATIQFGNANVRLNGVTYYPNGFITVDAATTMILDRTSFLSNVPEAKLGQVNGPSGYQYNVGRIIFSFSNSTLPGQGGIVTRDG